MIRKLSEHKGAECRVVIQEDGLITFTSYVTDVIHAMPIGDGKYEIDCTGTYSRTTIRQISWFMSEYFPALSYYEMKAIAGTCKTVVGQICKYTLKEIA